MLADRRGDLRRERAGVADACGAAVADEVEADRVEVVLEAGPLEVLGDDLRARGERRLDPRPARETQLARLAGEQAGGDHHGRVRGVRAARDRGDHDVAVSQLGGGAVGHRHGDGAVPARGGREPGAVRLLQVAGGLRARRRAAGRVTRREGLGGLLVLHVHVLDVALELVAEALLGDAQRHAILRPARARDRRLDGAEVEGDGVGEGRLLAVLVVPEALLLRVRLDERDCLGRAAGELEVADRLRIDREDRARRAELGAHVAERRAIGERQAGDAGAVELDELADDALGAQHLRDREHEIRGGRALGQATLEPEADDLRDEHRHRLAEHRRLGLDAAHAPAQEAQAVDHRRVRIGADERVGIGLRRALAVLDEDDAREVLEVDLVDDAGVRRNDLEGLEGLLAPLEELVALAVALELALGVDREGVGGAEGVDLHRVVDHELRRDERLDLGRVAAELGHRVAHRSEVHDGRHAGEVLEHHARRGEGDLRAGLRLRVPRGERLDVVRRHGAVALRAQEVLQQDLQRIRQPGNVEALLERVEAEDLIRPVADLKVGPGTEAVGGHGWAT
ncbi:unannotated protein [freshwater metagenome]|uniref:Unannotated protein n=1 Tax=freshwater metagenome TaxID=449393 RepID=A0A6J7DV01_9ZZZZ